MEKAGPGCATTGTEPQPLTPEQIVVSANYVLSHLQHIQNLEAQGPLSEEIVQYRIVITEQYQKLMNSYQALLTLSCPPDRPKPDQTWSMFRVATEYTPISWEPLFKKASADLNSINGKIEVQPAPGTDYPYFPCKADIFAAMMLTRSDHVKVVIIGQDPYPHMSNRYGLPTATGLAFSARRKDPVPKSLQNIFKELAKTVKGFRRPDHGDLTRWAEQGVLLLNRGLTVLPQQAKSQVACWMPFIIRTLEFVQTQNSRTIFILWGQEAQKLQRYIYSVSNVITGGHPSPLSENLFFDGDYFNKVNQRLIETKQQPIDWNLD